MAKKITITFPDDNDRYFDVVDDDGRYTGGLCWDEMLAQVVNLTHLDLGKPRYPMLTKAEHEEEERKRKERIAQSKAPFAIDHPTAL